MTPEDSDTPMGDDEPTEETETATPPRDPETGQFLPSDERLTDAGEATDGDPTDGADHDALGDPTTEGDTDQTLEDESPDDHQTETANAGSSSGEREPEPMPDEPESEPTAGEEPTESSDEAERTGTESLAEEARTDQASDEDETDQASDEARTDQASEQHDDSTVSGEPVPGGETERTTQEPPAVSPSGRNQGPRPTSRSPVSGGREPSTASNPPTGPVFVPNPNGYPRPPTLFLPTHPWLRLPSRPPDHETVSRRK